MKIKEFRERQGEILKERRYHLILKQKDVSQKLKVSINALYRWEAGRNSPKSHELYLLANLYQCTIQELFPP